MSLLGARGATFVDAGTGDLACGTSGKGRMAEPQAVYDAVLRRLAECGTVNS
jgi:phosphopantothenoylcysteine synthetase/decarboxylase